MSFSFFSKRRKRRKHIDLLIIKNLDTNATYFLKKKVENVLFPFSQLYSQMVSVPPSNIVITP